MEAFGIEEGACGAGSGSYALGLITLPDGSSRGVETVTRLAIRADAASGVAGRTASAAGSMRDAIGPAKAAPLALRLALSTLRAGLGAIEEGLGPTTRATVDLGFSDGTEVVALMDAETAALIRRDAGIARAAIERAGRAMPPATTSPDTAPDAALTSIFRYEKRHGRLRRVAGTGGPES